MSFRFRIPKTVKQFARIFEESGYSCYLVGGAVRNMVLHRKPEDYDFATDAQPKEVMHLFKRVIPTGVEHGTVTVLFKGQQFEVTTFRIESDYSDARHPDTITFTSSIEEDLSRRDFTINSMAIRIPDGDFFDPFGGRDDLKRGVVRTVGNATERIEEDALRMVRACRFSAQLEFDVDSELRSAMKEVAGNISNVSSERVREELEKMLTTRYPSFGFHEMERSRLLEHILPELSACRGIPQGGFHSFDVLDHSLYACDGAPENSIELRFAALFHDIGKAVTVDRVDLAEKENFEETGEEEADSTGMDYSFDDAHIKPTFYGHEEESDRLTGEICRRFRFSNAAERTIRRLVHHHMFHYTEEWSDAAVRRFVARVGTDLIEDLFTLRRADTYGMHRRYVHNPLLEQFRERIHRVMEEEQALTVKDLDINGHILAEEAGIPKGPEMGKVIEHLLETVLDDPSMNTKEKLLGLARSFYATYLKRN